MAMHFTDYSVIVIYIIAVLWIGALFSKSKKSSEDYLLGGRSMPPWAIGISCMMSVVSSVSMVSVTGEIYSNGLDLFLFSLLTPLLSIPCFFLFTIFYFKLGSFTPYEYLEYRYSPAVRSLISFSSLYGRIFYLGSVLFTTAKIFEGAYQWPPWFTILLVGIIGAIYTVMGGMKAVVWTDVVQFFMLLFGFVIVIVALCFKVDGGAEGILNCAWENGRLLNRALDPDFYKVTPYVRLSFWLMLMGFVTGQLTLASSDQITIQRFLSTKDWKAALRARLVASFSTYPYTIAIFFIGLAVFAFYQQNPPWKAISGDGAFFHFVTSQLPTPIPGIFMAAMLAAIMSTLDSGMNSMATVYLKEFHSRYFNRNMTPEQEVDVSKKATLAVGIVSITFGLALEFTGKWLSASAAEIGALFAFLGEVTLPAFLFAVLSKKANSTLIWLITGYGFGTTMIHKFWYAASTRAVIEWSPGDDMGWGGIIGDGYWLGCLAVALLLGIPALILHTRRKRTGLVLLVLSAAFLGASEVFGVWRLYSSFTIQDMPLARSFNFGYPSSLIIGWIALLFCKSQPKEKYQGLTIFTLKEPIVKKED